MAVVSLVAGNRHCFFIEYLEFLRQLFENEDFDAVIDKVYPMEQVIEAHRYVDTGRKKGNVVLKINQ